MTMPPIQHIIMMGDSLSDRGTLAKRKLLGLLPFEKLSGLEGKSPKGRFTNGYVWSDAFATKLANELIIESLKKRGERATDIADDVITHSPLVERKLNYYDLDHDQYVEYDKSLDLVRNYDEGGLTAYNYDGKPGPIRRVIEGKILANLDAKRKKLLEDDEYRAINQDHKNKSLIIEWSGANDLITINDGVYELKEGKISKEVEVEIEHAVQARINNVRELAKNGYRNFVLFNLPDLSLTPRFQTGKGKDSKEGAQKASEHFNQVLKQESRKLKRELTSKYGDVELDVFDVSSVFSDAYENPNKYGIDEDKLTTPYTKSNDFEIKKDNTSPAKGYMFYDDVHPTEDVHEVLAQKFYDSKIFKKYQMQAPSEDLIAQFIEAYGARLEKEQHRFFIGWMYKSNLSYKKDSLSLKDILNHAFGKDGKGSGKRTRQVIEKLGWIDSKGNIRLKNLDLESAHQSLKIDASHEKRNTPDL
jgi:phospholipase/lecithinase/hemolysin